MLTRNTNVITWKCKFMRPIKNVREINRLESLKLATIVYVVFSHFMIIVEYLFDCLQHPRSRS